MIDIAIDINNKHNINCDDKFEFEARNCCGLLTFQRSTYMHPDPQLNWRACPRSYVCTDYLQVRVRVRVRILAR